MPSLTVVNAPGELPPVPSAWYAVGFAEELPAGAVLSRTLAGRELVVFRTATGVFTALDAYCPHLGAHLGRGGQVVGESLRCPMHGFCFDTEGACVSTPYGKRIPPRARIRSWPVMERNGVLLVYFDPHGHAPSWEPPALASDGWTHLAWHSLSFRGHPQEVSENSADAGHFSVVHGYESTQMELVSSTGAYFHTRASVVRPRGLVRKNARIRMELDIHVHGLGYSQVDVSIPDLALNTQVFVLPTPTTPSQLELRIAVRVREDFSPRRLHPLLALVPRLLVRPIMLAAGLRNYLSDVRQDVDFWSSKAYMPRPALAEGDGPIGQYRKWTRQFYGEPPLARGDLGAKAETASPAA